MYTPPSPHPPIHLSKQLAHSSERVSVKTRYGSIVGGRALNGCAAWLEILYAHFAGRFEDPVSLDSVDGFKYPAEKEYLYETAYAAQPSNDGQAAGVTPADKLGLGKPSENLLFLNIVTPPPFNPSSPSQTRKYPVKIYIHGGFLQFGSPHGLSALATSVSALRNEVWVNVGYRLSAFGFLAGEVAYEGEEAVRLNGNYGFKDAWLAVKWVRENITAFGGDEDDITLTGLSAGAHVVHQLLHRAAAEALHLSRCAPFDRVMLQSNAILATPKRPAELTTQLLALLYKLGLLPSDTSSAIPRRDELVAALSTLRDPTHVPIARLTRAIKELDAEALGTFRGCLSRNWIPGSSGEEISEEWDHVERQRNGDLSKGLKKAGVRSVLIGEVMEEWYLYAIAHECSLPNGGDNSTNEEVLDWVTHTATRYVSLPVAEQFVHAFKELILPENAEKPEVKALFERARERAGLGRAQVLAGVVLSAVQVYVPVRRFEREVGRRGEEGEGVPVVRYVIEWAPEAAKKWGKGYITHATDRPIWTLSTALSTHERDIAENWIDVIQMAVQGAEKGGEKGLGLAKREGKVLVLDGSGAFDWKNDWREGELRRVGLL